MITITPASTDVADEEATLEGTDDAGFDEGATDDAGFDEGATDEAGADDAGAEDAGADDLLPPPPPLPPQAVRHTDMANAIDKFLIILLTPIFAIC
ncbi:MAG TPA: hypothetical protein VL995_18130 [Cellvibrio sp.]|nr:hypothetical protein [Cellvibrio sp.]